ncbi:MAG: hypothetical protein VZR56_12705, partial [Treponema sp.]|nr:hypothetical protein [Treponema sp.]
TSCQNFLTGGEIKQQIEDEIARANAKKIDIRIAVDSPEYGSVYPTQVTVIKGDSFSLEFTKASGSEFLEWICVDSSTNMVLDDAVTFTNQSGEKNKFTVTAQLNCESENLVIKPYCYLPTETTPPEFKVLRLAKTEEDAINGTNLISFDAFTHYATKTTYGGDTAKLAEGIREHHVNSLWVYVEAEDDSSGVGQLIIEEKYIRKQDGTDVAVSTGPKTVLENPSMSKNLKKAFKLDFKSADGVLKLSFSIKDRAGNSSEYGNTVDVVKDTYFSASFVLYDWNPKKAESSSFNYTYSFPIVFSDRGVDEDELPCFITDADGKNHYKISSLPKPEDDDYDVNVDYNYYEKFDVPAVYWGYDENNMKPVDSFFVGPHTGDYFGTTIEGDFTHVSFTVDRRKNVCVKVIAKDACGNVSESVGYISKGIDILSCKEESDSWTLTLSGTLDSKSNFYIDGTEESLIYGFYVVYTDPSGHVSRPRMVSTFPTSSSTSEIELTKIVYGEGSDYLTNSTNISDLPDGTYEIYCMPTSAYFTWILFIPLVLPTFSTAAGKPYTIYKGVTAPAAPNPTMADLPSSFTVNVDPPVKNTGKRTVHISYPSGFTPNPKLNYAIKYSNSKNTVSEFSISKDFEIPTQYCSWNFEIHAFNSSGKSVCSSPVSKNLTNSRVNDNLPPTANLTLHKSSPTSLSFKYNNKSLPFNDDPGGYGIKARSERKTASTTKYTVSLEYTLAYQSGLEDKIDWTGNGIKTASYSYTNSNATTTNRFSLSLLGLSGTYLYMRVFDKNDNYLVYRYPYEILKMTEKAYAEKSGSTVYVKCERGNTDTECDISLKYCSGNEWVEITTPSSMGRSGEIFSCAPSFTAEQQNSFVFAQPWHKTDASYSSSGELKTEGQIVVYKPLYFCPAYYLETGFKCRQKNYIEGSRGLEILSDKTVLVHTFYSTYDYGNSYEKWLENALETGVRSEPSSFTYDYDNLDGVPAGNYYTTIIHYADGTVDMTKVKRM